MPGNAVDQQFFEDFESMPEGKIKRLTDKGFGFIDTGTGKDMFFHSSNLVGVGYAELRGHCVDVGDPQVDQTGTRRRPRGARTGRSGTRRA